MSKLSEIVDWCVNSMETEPEAWRRDSPLGHKLYYVAHRCGVTVWLSNGHWGLGVYPNACDWFAQDELGGVTGWSVFFGSLIPWRRRLRRAAMKVAGQETRSGAAEAIMAKIGRDSPYEHASSAEH